MDSDRRTAIETALDNPAGGPSGAVEYDPGNSFLHRLHPATKLVVALGIVATVFLFGDFRGPLVVLLALLVLLAVVGYLRVIGRTAFLISLPIGVSLLVVHGLFNPQNTTQLFVLEPVPVLGRLVVWEEGIRFGLLFYFRLTAVIVAILTLIRTTHARKLSIGLADKGVPTKLTFVFMSALQLAPQMKDRAREIVEAQQARGLDTRSTYRERLRSLIAMLTPLFISMLISTQTRALALESRGFSREGPITNLVEVTDTAVDRALRWATVVVVVALFVGLVVL